MWHEGWCRAFMILWGWVANRSCRRATGSEALVLDSDLHVCAESADRVSKERAMRRCQLKWLWKRLRELAAMEISPTAWRLVEIDMDRAW